MIRHPHRTWVAVLAGIVGGAVLAGALGGSEADAARGSKKRRKTSPARDAGAAVDAARDHGDAGPARSPTAASASGAAVTAPPYPSSGLVCLYGKATEDGGERCLSPEELDPPRLVFVDTRALAEKLGMLRPEPPDPDDGGVGQDGAPEGPDDGSELSSDGSFKARVVRVQFENGAVGGAMGSLKRIRRDMADCVADNGGLRSDSARLKLLFYVRADGKASGVTVASARNIPPAVLRCVTRLIEGASVGRPSNNPVGVKTLIELKENDRE